MTMLASRQIKMRDARLFEDFRLKNSSPERINEVTAVGTAYDSVLCADFTYVSTPITSGAILYQAMDELGVRDADEFRKDKDAFYEKVIQPNIKAADEVAQVMLNFGGAVIAPAAFEARSLGWGQDEYMGLWLDTIERKATRLALVDGWEYSNGGAEEYLQALLMQAGRRDRNTISIVDSRGDIISHITAVQLLHKAVHELIERGFRSHTLEQVLIRVFAVHSFVYNEAHYGIRTDRRDDRNEFEVSSHYGEGFTSVDEYFRSKHILRELSRSISPLVDQPVDRFASSLQLTPNLIRSSGLEDLSKAPANYTPPLPESNLP